MVVYHGCITHHRAMSSRTYTFAIFGVFFTESAVLGNWIPRIPDIQQNLGLSVGELGFSLFAMPLGTLAGLFVAARIIEYVGGLRRACQIFLPLWALSFILPSLASTQWGFVVFLFVSGLTIGLVEVAMNTEADRIECFYGKKIMSRCHGFWSLGSMAGALTGGLIAQAGISVAAHFSVVFTLIAIFGFAIASCLPKPAEVSVVVSEDQSAPLIRLPSKAILLLCLLPIGSMVVEGAFIDWSAVFMRSIFEASPLVIGVTYSFFAVVMAIVRLAGDNIREQYGERFIVQVSGIAATAGVVLFALSPNAMIAFAAAAISGMGVAIVYPLAVTAAARRPGRSSADNVASLTMISFSAFLFAPPVIGLLSELFGLRVALLLLAPLAISTFFLSAEIEPEADHAGV